MINRYKRKEIESIFSVKNKYNIWLEIELAVLKVLKASNTIDVDLKCIKKPYSITEEEVTEKEKINNHEVVSFLETVWGKFPCLKKYLHFGLTSQDIMDTALFIQILQAGKITLNKLKRLTDLFREKAIEYKHIPILGRTHGRGAEPTSLGLRFLSFFSALQRESTFLKKALEECRVGKLSGTVGTYPVLSPEIEKRVLKQFNLSPEPVATQVIPRDRIAQLISSMAIISKELDRFAHFIRLSQIDGIDELHEPFKKGQTGSSAMPHKKNPIIAERISGLSRLISSFTIPSLENIPLWWERDISHSSVERIIIEDSFHILNYLIELTEKIVSDVVINTRNIENNLKGMNELYISQKLLSLLISKGMERETAYKLVQKYALVSHKEKISFLKLLLDDKQIKRIITSDELKKHLDIKGYLKNINNIYKRMGINEKNL